MRRRYGWVLVLLVASGCGNVGAADGRQDAADGGATPDGMDGASPDALVLDSAPSQDAAFLTHLPSAEALASLASAESAAVKYLLPVAGRPPFAPLSEACYFQNMRRYPWHLQFLQSFPQHADMSYEDYLSLVLQAPSRRLWGGGVLPSDSARHPTTGLPGVIAYTLYAEPGSERREDVVEVDRTLKGCMPFASDRLVFVPESQEQQLFLARERAALALQGVASLFPADLVPPIPNNQGGALE